HEPANPRRGAEIGVDIETGQPHDRQSGTQVLGVVDGGGGSRGIVPGFGAARRRSGAPGSARLAAARFARDGGHAISSGCSNPPGKGNGSGSTPGFSSHPLGGAAPGSD